MAFVQVPATVSNINEDITYHYSPTHDQHIFAYLSDDTVYRALGFNTQFTALVTLTPSAVGNALYSSMCISDDGEILVMLAVNSSGSYGTDLFCVNYSGSVILNTQIQIPDPALATYSNADPIGCTFDTINQKFLFVYKSTYNNVFASNINTYEVGVGLGTSIELEAYLSASSNSRREALWNRDFSKFLLRSGSTTHNTYTTAGSFLATVTDTGGNYIAGQTRSGWIYAGSNNDLATVFVFHRIITFNFSTAQATVVTTESTDPTWQIVSVGAKLNLAGDKVLVYSLLEKITDQTKYIYRIYSYDIVSGSVDTGSKTLITALSESTFTGGTPYRGFGIWSEPDTDAGEPIRIHVSRTSPRDVMWEQWVPTLVNNIDLTASLGTSGGRSLTAFIDATGAITLVAALSKSGGSSLSSALFVNQIQRIISFLQLTNNVLGTVVSPQDELYFLTLDDTVQIPLIAFTIRSLNVKGAVEINVNCAVPLDFLEELYSAGYSTARIDKFVYGESRILVNGSIDGLTVSSNVVNVKVSSSESLIAGDVNLNKIIYVRDIDSTKSMRVAPYTSIKVGNTIITQSDTFEVKKLTLHVSNDQRFLELS